MEVLAKTNLPLIAAIAAILPLVSFFSILLFSKKGGGSRIAIFNILASFILSLALFLQVWNNEPVYVQIHWFTIGQYRLSASIILNNLSVLMLLLVSGISLVVHVYSLEYMRNDPFLHRYWAYLGLFCFSMMSLVIAGNLLLVYMFWELVGFSSYLLIGFWFTRDAAAQAGKKAFVMNRIGDLGFLAGLMIIFAQFGTFDIQQLFGENGLLSHAVVRDGLWISASHRMPGIWLSIAGAVFFWGAMAKSAQFPLHTWLPDAMQGPTSISSLIHAATMVAAGVFLIMRIYPVFDQHILMIITITGLFTALMAATIALVQNDIKRILAFSTISQLGFMMLALGTGVPDAAIFHLSAHAFFKCLLFLAAGAIIHELHHLKTREGLDFDHQDIRNMGGLRKQMPVTFITMLIASLSLAGIPFTSGFLSKDAILIQAFKWAGHDPGFAVLIPWLAMLTSWITAFYTSRLIFKVFFGERRIAKAVTVHDPAAAMKIPLIILALCSLFPLFSFNPFSNRSSWLTDGFPVRRPLEHIDLVSTFVPVIVTLVSAGLIYLAYSIYVKRDQSREHVSGSSPVYRFLHEQWYIDNAYRVLFVKSLMFVSRISYGFDRKVIDGIVNIFGKAGLVLASLAAFLDRYVVDALVNLLGSLSKTIGNFMRHFQTGRVQHYMFSMLLAALAFFILKYFIQVI